MVQDGGVWCRVGACGAGWGRVVHGGGVWCRVGACGAGWGRVVQGGGVEEVRYLVVNMGNAFQVEATDLIV